MYKVETHNNSKKYFEEIVIEEDSFYIASTTTLRAVLNKERKKLEKDVYLEDDICEPKSPYAVAKKLSEEYISTNCKSNIKISTCLFEEFYLKY